MSRHKKLHGSQTGFTLVELMISTLAFSIVLLGATSALIQVGRMYFKGYIGSLTQQTTRSVIDNVSRQIQFGSSSVFSGTQVYGTGPDQVTVDSRCVGNQRYSYTLNRQVSDDPVLNGTVDLTNSRMRHALWRDIVNDTEAATCTPQDLRQDQPSTGKEGVELLGQHMRLKNFNVVQQSGTPEELWNVSVAVIYGDDDLIIFTDPGNKTGPISCTGLSGSQWCSLSELNTQVLRRLR